MARSPNFSFNGFTGADARLAFAAAHRLVVDLGHDREAVRRVLDFAAANNAGGHNMQNLWNRFAHEFADHPELVGDTGAMLNGGLDALPVPTYDAAEIEAGYKANPEDPWNAALKMSIEEPEPQSSAAKPDLYPTRSDALAPKRMAELETVMRDEPDRYWGDKTLQQEFASLHGADAWSGEASPSAPSEEGEAA